MLELLLPPTVRAATDSLSQALLASEPFGQYLQAQERLTEDTEARTLLTDLSAAQANLRGNPATTQADIARVRTLQRDVQANAVIQDYALAQQGAIDALREANTEISQLLGVNFAALAKRTGCC